MHYNLRYNVLFKAIFVLLLAIFKFTFVYQLLLICNNYGGEETRDLGLDELCKKNSDTYHQARLTNNQIASCETQHSKMKEYIWEHMGGKTKADHIKHINEGMKKHVELNGYSVTITDDGKTTFTKDLKNVDQKSEAVIVEVPLEYKSSTDYACPRGSYGAIVKKIPGAIVDNLPVNVFACHIPTGYVMKILKTFPKTFGPLHYVQAEIINQAIGYFIVEDAKTSGALFSKEQLENLSVPTILPKVFKFQRGAGDSKDIYGIIMAEVKGNNLLDYKPKATICTKDIMQTILRIPVVFLNHEFIHSDFKPANLMMESDGRVWIIDFTGASVSRIKRGTHFTRDYIPESCIEWINNDNYYKKATDFGTVMKCITRQDMYALTKTCNEICREEPFDDCSPNPEIKKKWEETITTITKSFESFLSDTKKNDDTRLISHRK